MKNLYGIITLVLSSVLVLSGCYNKDGSSTQLSSVPENNIITATAQHHEPTVIPSDTPLSANGSLEVHYIDVGQADSSLVMCDG